MSLLCNVCMYWPSQLADPRHLLYRVTSHQGCRIFLFFINKKLFA
jgi:hypothetical protein